MTGLHTPDELPQALQTEITVLGAMLLDEGTREDAVAALKADDFSLDSHRTIFTAMRKMMERGEGIDLVTLKDAMGERAVKSVGDVAYLAFLTEGIPRNPHVESYVRTVKNKSLLRKVMAICNDGMVGAADICSDPMTLIGELEAALQAAGAGGEVEASLEAQGEAEFEVLERQRTGEVAVFVTSGLEPLDAAHGGYAIGEMTVLAARPRVGKSTLLRQAIVANCENGDYAHLFTPEMRAGQVLRCLWAMVAQVPFNKVRHPERMSDRELRLVQAAKAGVSAWPLKIDDAAKMTAPEMIASARRTERRHKTKLMGVDYLQKLRYGGRVQDRHTEVTDAMVALTAYAKTSGAALVVISSLTEGEGKNKNPIPTLSALRGSGDIQFEANTVYLLHREMDGETQKLQPETLLIAAKARADEGGSRKIYFDGAMQRFEGDEYLRRVGGTL